MKVSSLKFNKRNPRKISEKNKINLKKSLQKFGDLGCIVSNQTTGNLISGHQRISCLPTDATIKIEQKYKKPNSVGTIAEGYIEINGERFKYREVEWDEEMEVEAMLAANNQGGENDDELLRVVLKDFPKLDLDLVGIELPEINVIAPVEGEDDVPEVKESICKMGDLWILGSHRLLCGDSTNVHHVERLMGSEKADIGFTSPPYNAGCFGFQGGKDKYKGKTDDRSQDEYFQFLSAFTSIALEVSGIILVNNQFLSGNIHGLAKYIGTFSDQLKDVFCWVKNTAPPNVNPGVFTNRWEAIYAFEKDCKKKGFPVSWQGKYSNVIEGETAARENENVDTHTATMPTYLPLWFLDRLDYVKSVYEPFAGTGTTAIACEKTNRKCFMMEIDPHYCDVIISRWEKFSGGKAQLSQQK